MEDRFLSGLEAVASPTYEYHPGLEAAPSQYHWHRFHILQESNSTQQVALEPDSIMHYYPTFEVKCNASTGFMNRKPDVLIRREGDKKEPIAKGRFEKYGVGTSVEYPDASLKQQIQLESSASQRYNLFVNGRQCTWHPHAMEKNLVDLDMDGEGLCARIVTSRLVEVEKGSLVAVLQVREDMAEQRGMLDQIVCTGVVLVERLRRRTLKVSAIPHESSLYWGGISGAYSGVGGGA